MALRKHFSVILLLVLVSSLIALTNAQASTPTSGTISSDTTWTKDASPYILTGGVIIDGDAVLTIEPGVTVDFNGWYLQVDGALHAKGTSENKITLTSHTFSLNQRITFANSSKGWQEETGTGSIIENTNINKVCLYVAGSPKVNNNYINATYQMTVTDGAPVISNNKIDCSETGIYATGGCPTISGNNLKGIGAIAGIVCKVKADILGNIVTGFTLGIQAANSSIIKGNQVLYNNLGIEYRESATVQNNLIMNNKDGLSGGRGIIQANTIVNNSRKGITFSAPPLEASNNNIYNNKYNVALSCAEDINAVNNWWGITDADAINQTIYDKKASSELGKVSFLPFLSGPNPSAPSVEDIVVNPTSTITSPTPSVSVSTGTPAATSRVEPTDDSSAVYGTLSFSDIITLAVIVVIIVGIALIVIIVYVSDKKLKVKNT